MNLLVAGGAGFIGSDFVRLALSRYPGSRIVVLDALTYAGNLETLADVVDAIDFVHASIQDAQAVDRAIRDHGITHIVNFAAESHNDRSIEDATQFLATNAVGVYVLLEAVRRHGIEKFVHVSTDEVYGSTLTGEFSELSPLEPNTPYSASKAAGDLQCRAHHIAYRTPVCVTRGGNTFGPYQYPEKLIPFFTTRLIDGKKVPVYGSGDQVREWIYVRDHALGIAAVLDNGVPGQVYNVGDRNERPNHEIVDVLLAETGRDRDLVKSIPDPRKGAHDARYSMTTEKIGTLGWAPTHDFESSLRATVRWYRENESWWRTVTAKPGYDEFISRFYGPGLGEDL